MKQLETSRPIGSRWTYRENGITWEVLSKTRLRLVRGTWCNKTPNLGVHIDVDAIFEGEGWCRVDFNAYLNEIQNRASSKGNS